MKKLYLLDASGYLYRSYFAIRGITNAKGESTNALYGFTRSVQKLFNDFQPDYFAAVFDGPRGIAARKTLYADYKAHRAKTPEDLRYQIGWAQEYCDLMGLSKLVIEEVEADDTMGSVAKWAKRAGVEVYLCTSDKDMAQLVNDNVFLLNTFNENLILDKAGVQQKWGIAPSQMIDYLAICGDASDNIPGIAGIGPKTAANLLHTHGNLDTLLQIPESLSPKQKILFKENKELVNLSRQLVTIVTDVAIPREESFYKVQKPRIGELKSFFTKMNFNSLLKDLEGAQEPEVGIDYQLIDTEEKLASLVKTLEKEKEICFDTETTDTHPLRAEIVGIGLGVKERQAWYIPLNGQMPCENARALLKPLFENSKIGFYGHNVKYGWHVLKKWGITVANLSFDTILASYLLHSHSRQHSLDHLSLVHFSKIKTPIQDLIGKGKNQITMMHVPIEKAAAYCAEDVDYTIRLKTLLEKELEERGLQDLFYKLELPVLQVLARMEQNGIYLDKDVLAKQGIEILKECQSLTEQIYELAAEKFNVNSPKQVGEILFGKMGLRPPKKTQTGFSTSAQVLEELQHVHPIVGKILEYRTVEKLRSTYIETLPLQVVPYTGRIHPTFNQSVAATGRLSCQDPNLQNIPIRSEVGKKIREAFRPEKNNWSFLAGDYSQIELRLLAHFSQDPNLCKAFHNKEDVHAYTASLVFHIPLAEVTSAQRRQAKAVNFGIIYGQQAFGLSKELGISMEEAKTFIEAYFKQYPKVQEYLEASKEQARKTHKAVTVCGREREIPEITSKNPQLRNQAERLAINTPLQGSAADLIKLAMIRIDRMLAEEKMVLQVHDELIFEVPDTHLESFSPRVKEVMEGAMKLGVPLVVDISIGKNWKIC